MKEAAASAHGPVRFRSSNEVAKWLGVSPSGLRRLANIYSAACEELPRDSRTKARLWPQVAVAELAAARRLVSLGRAVSVKEALGMVRRGEAPPAETDDGPAAPERDEQDRNLPDELRELRKESLALREALGGLKEAVSVLALEVRSLRAERGAAGLPLAADDDLAGEQVQDQPVPGRSELRLLRRRLHYLETELELRDL